MPAGAVLREIWPGGHGPESDEALREAVAQLIDAGVIDPETGALRAGELHAEDLDPEVIAALQWLGQLMAGAQESRDGAQEQGDSGRSGATRSGGSNEHMPIFFRPGGESAGRAGDGEGESADDVSKRRDEAARSEHAAQHGRQQQGDADKGDSDKVDADKPVHWQFMPGHASGSETRGEVEQSVAGESAAQREQRAQHASDRMAAQQVEQQSSTQSAARGVTPIWTAAAVADAPAEARAAQVEQWIALMNRSVGDGGRATTFTTLSAGQSSFASAGSSAGSITGEAGGGVAASSSSLLDASSRFTGQVMRGMTAVMNQQGGSMTMRLDPPELGQLRIQMTVSRGVVTASFQASTAQATQLIEQNMSTLRTSLEQHGMTVERLTVQQPPTATHTSDARDDGGQHRQQHDSSSDGRHRGGSGDDGRQHDDGQASNRRGFNETFQRTVDHSDDERDQKEALR